MADKKISALTGASTPLAGTEVLPIVQGGATVNVSVANLTAGRAVAMAGGSFTDNIAQGTAAKGINFTANTPAAGMTSQLLNWYEEGTWTPSVGGDATYTIQKGSYVKVGKVITAIFDIQINVLGTGLATTLGGLPFTNNANTTAAFLPGYFTGLSTSVVALYGRCDVNANNIVFEGLTASATDTPASTNIFQNGTRLIGQITYITA